MEAARHGITVTTAVPGLMRTGSPRNALFTGDRAAEHRWFTLADSVPLLSMDAERAAAKRVRAALRGSPEVILTPAAKVANRLLPSDETRTPLAPGHAVAPVRRPYGAHPARGAPVPPARRSGTTGIGITGVVSGRSPGPAR